MDLTCLKEQIRSAFIGETLGDGVGLMQAQGLDDYADVAMLASYRAADEKNDWSKIEADQLNQCYSSLSFFDAEGMRFHLPAFLIAYLAGTFRQDILFALTYAEHENLSRFNLLSNSQRNVVRDFLNYELERSNDFNRPMIEQALAGYWNK
jgi:hypothetical protein